MSCEETVCIVCQKSFINNKRLQIHLIKKHSVRNDQNVTKYKCDKCDKVYTTRANLSIHERSHTGCVSCLLNLNRCLFRAIWNHLDPFSASHFIYIHFYVEKVRSHLSAMNADDHFTRRVLWWSINQFTPGQSNTNAMIVESVLRRQTYANNINRNTCL